MLGNGARVLTGQVGRCWRKLCAVRVSRELGAGSSNSGTPPATAVKGIVLLLDNRVGRASRMRRVTGVKGRRDRNRSGRAGGCSTGLGPRTLFLGVRLVATLLLGDPVDTATVARTRSLAHHVRVVAVVLARGRALASATRS